MLLHYLNIKTGSIGEYNGVSGSVLNFDNLPEEYNLQDYRYAKLSDAQVTRYNTQKALLQNGSINTLDLNYILTGEETPEPEPTLEELKEVAKTTLKTNLYLLTKDGHSYNGFVFNYDNDTTMNIIKQKNRYELEGGDLFKITDSTKTQRQFTKAQLWEFGAGFSSFIAPLEERYADIRNDIDKATTKEALEAIDLDLSIEE